MSLAERVARATDRFYDRMRSREAGDIAIAPLTGRLEDLRGRKYCVLVTYKRDGTPVPSPLWFGTGNGRLYFQTGVDSAKVKRIKATPSVRVAAATSRGRPVSGAFAGTARVVPPDEAAEAERCLQANYGLGRRLYALLSDRVSNVYVEVTPSDPPA
jgi:PPOX class probable F420-dependent enzyme